MEISIFSMFGLMVFAVLVSKILLKESTKKIPWVKKIDNYFVNQDGKTLKSLGFEKRTTPDGKSYWLDHVNRVTYWDR